MFQVEMFAITKNGDHSHDMYLDFMRIQKQIFTQLGLHFRSVKQTKKSNCENSHNKNHKFVCGFRFFAIFRIMNMASGELGAPAHCKFDIEAWMPNLKFYGEVYNLH